MLPRRLSRKDGQIIVLVGIVLAATVVVAAAASSYMYSVGTEVPTSRSTNILPELLNIKDKFGAALNYTVNQMGIDNISDAFNETLYRFNLIEMKHGIFLDANHDDDWYWVYSGYGSNAAFQAEVNLTISGEYITITKHIRYPLVVNVTGGGTTPPAKNQPPDIPKIKGPKEEEGVVGEEYKFTAETDDPDGDQIKYGWDWNGDGTVDEWSSKYFDSDEPCSMQHSWDTEGTYSVQVKAQDTEGAESKFSESWEIVIKEKK